MKAMTWLKLGGGVLVALAAFAAADTRYAEVTGNGPVRSVRHAIALQGRRCPVSQKIEQTKSACCNDETKEVLAHQSGCCRN
jgi:hypothetical protein